jgi:hypothetical protein
VRDLEREAQPRRAGDLGVGGHPEPDLPVAAVPCRPAQGHGARFPGRSDGGRPGEPSPKRVLRSVPSVVDPDPVRGDAR